MMLRLVNSESEAILAEAGLSLTITDRLSISDFGVNIPVVQFPTPGRYEFQLYREQRILRKKRISRHETESSADFRTKLEQFDRY